MLAISIFEIHHDSTHELGDDPGLIKDGVEADLQRLSAGQIEVYGEGFNLIRREYPTAIGPVDILARDSNESVVAIEIKRRGDIDGVEQLTRYLELLNRDPTLAPVTGIFAAQEIKPQARTLAEDRGIRCVVLDLDALRGGETDHDRLF
jgi:RecB family endonuclease NucS